MATKTKAKKKTTTRTAQKLKYQITDPIAPELEAAYDGDVGFDLVSTIKRTISSSQTIMVPTGIKIELPSKYWGSIREKSGVSLNTSISIKAGVIDPGYRGEVKVILYNHSLEPLTINKGDKIAQLVLHPVVKIKTEKSEIIDEETERGEKGFGSSDG